MNIPENLMYTKEHEWVQNVDGSTIRVGLTDFAQDELGDIVFVNLPQVGDSVVKGESFADVESVKAVSDVFSPANGTVKAVNEALADDAALINSDCYGAWLIEIADVEEKENLLTAAEYEAFIKEEG